MTARRWARLAAGLFAALVLATGCTAAELPGAAAIVDGTVIPTEDVAATTEQINSVIEDATQQMSETQTAYWMVIAPFVNAKASSAGRWTPDDAFNSLLAGIHDPSESTVAVLKARFAVQSLTQEDTQEVIAQIAAADIRLNPQYGTIDPETGGLVNPEPNWIKPVPTETAAP